MTSSVVSNESRTETNSLFRWALVLTSSIYLLSFFIIAVCLLQDIGNYYFYNLNILVSAIISIPLAIVAGAIAKRRGMLSLILVICSVFLGTYAYDIATVIPDYGSWNTDLMLERIQYSIPFSFLDQFRPLEDWNLYFILFLLSKLTDSLAQVMVLLTAALALVLSFTGKLTQPALIKTPTIHQYSQPESPNS